MTSLCRRKDDLARGVRKRQKQQTSRPYWSEDDDGDDNDDDDEKQVNEIPPIVFYTLDEFEEFKSKDKRQVTESPPANNLHICPQISVEITALTCPICFYNDENEIMRRTHSYGSKFNFWRHYEKVHLKFQRISGEYKCGCPGCTRYIDEPSLKFHLKEVHKMHISTQPNFENFCH
ncbi:hypothetical protein ABW20_dc0104564 [Dactylellina cionopaga]|nr:hypothetical protein ABW20_dc0104564 [Dactylellina cionopaga]